MSRVKRYIKNNAKCNGTWNDYEYHKKRIDKICEGDCVVYAEAVELLADKLGLF